MVTNEHLTEALRRLRKNSSDNNVDRCVASFLVKSDLTSRRLVTNILLSFLTTHRADSKRFEMLSLLSTILSWDDTEREKAGLQRVGNAGGKTVSKGSKGKGSKQEERSAEEEAAMNEVSLANFVLSDSTDVAVFQQPVRRVPNEGGVAWPGSTKRDGLGS